MRPSSRNKVDSPVPVPDSFSTRAFQPSLLHTKTYRAEHNWWIGAGSDRPGWAQSSLSLVPTLSDCWGILCWIWDHTGPIKVTVARKRRRGLLSHSDLAVGGDAAGLEWRGRRDQKVASWRRICARKEWRRLAKLAIRPTKTKLSPTGAMVDCSRASRTHRWTWSSHLASGVGPEAWRIEARDGARG
jgi:hypothetical protein